MATRREQILSAVATTLASASGVSLTPWPA